MFFAWLRRLLRNVPKTASRKPRILPLLEDMEPRLVPAISIWTGLGDKVHWSDDLNWNTHAPQNGDDVVFGSTGIANNAAAPQNDIADLFLVNIKIDNPTGAYTLH